MEIFVKRAILGLTLAASVSGCAPQPEAITATYVSAATYSSYSCRAIVDERNRVVQKVNELTGVQKKKADNDAVATGVGMVLFWPALFFLGSGSDVEPQLATMKGNYDALTSAGIQKGCFKA